jgi:hypothetical protein
MDLMADGVSFRGFASLRGSFDLAVYAKSAQNKILRRHLIRQRLLCRDSGQANHVLANHILFLFKPQRVGPRQGS